MTRLAIASNDGTARIWDCTPKLIRHAERHANARADAGVAVARWRRSTRSLL